MALIVDYYDMHETPYTHAKRLFTRWWGNGTYRSLMPESVLHGKVIRWMFLSKVYKDNHISRRTIEIAKKHSKGPLQDLGLPLGNIPGEIAHHPITPFKGKTEHPRAYIKIKACEVGGLTAT